MCSPWRQQVMEHVRKPSFGSAEEYASEQMWLSTKGLLCKFPLGNSFHSHLKMTVSRYMIEDYFLTVALSENSLLSLVIHAFP